jgi:hypothetical protein
MVVFVLAGASWLQCPRRLAMTVLLRHQEEAYRSSVSLECGCPNHTDRPWLPRSSADRGGRPFAPEGD